MMDYLTLKWLHILSSVLLVGTGFGSAFYLFFANRIDDVAVRAAVARLVVRADWWFTTPAVIFQPLSGLWLMHLAGWAWTTPWLAASIGLFVFTGLCWLPVVWLQIRMAAQARECALAGLPLPPDYRRKARLWEALGYPAFVAMLAIYYLMVVKPGL
jgi:uncharacterized membrane protein